MYRLGLRLTLQSGREALIRLIVTSVAVAIGVTIVLAVLADFHAFELTSNRPDWEGTHAMSAGQHGSANVELWNYSNEVFRGQTIERLDLAALGPNAPVPPGVSRLPRSGQYFASPALATLLRSVPRDELAGRFPGRLAGTIGDAALTGPNELVVYVGEPAARLAALPSTIRVDQIATAAGKQIWSHYFRDAFVVAAIAFLFPILILVGTATRLASARREERYAALRLVGATARDVNEIASVDAIVSASCGAALGVAIFALAQPFLAKTAITSAVYFPADVTPTVWGYLAVLVAVPAASAIASLLALRRVRVTPLGVSRRVSPPPPRLWRVVPLALGIGLFVVGMLTTDDQNIGAPVFPGLLMIMIGLVVAGPWLTTRAAGLLKGSASSLLAARRLSDDPKAAFRSVSGLVLAVFLGTIVAALLPAIDATTATPSARALSNVLLDGFTASPVCGNNVNCTGGSSPGLMAGNVSASEQRMALDGLPPAAGAKLLAGLRAFHGATVAPIYSLPQHANPGNFGADDAVVSCASMRALAALGVCAPGVKAVQASAATLFGDNPRFTSQAIIGPASPPASDDFSNLYLQAVLVKVNGQSTLERVRTFLITHTTESVSGTAPRTFGEAVQARLAVAATVQRLIDVAVALTLLVAGCSLAVVVGGSLVERKRPFTMLRLSGTSNGTLNWVVLKEAILPLVAATVVAAGTAYGISMLTIKKMAPAGTPLPALDHVYYLTMGSGLGVSLLVILAILPLLNKITGIENVRFE
jgi:hypothetical protein